MKYAVITPTLNRAALVDQLIASLEANAPGRQHFVYPQTHPKPLTTLINELCVIAFEQKEVSAVVYLADHCIVGEGFGDALLSAFEAFPDGDVLVDIPIRNVASAKAGCFWAAGRAFVERFENMQIQCPDYYHFYADTELALYASRIGKLGTCAIGVDIQHPNASNRMPDATHAASRTYLTHDANTWERRRARYLLWGESFERVHCALPWESL